MIQSFLFIGAKPLSIKAVQMLQQDSGLIPDPAKTGRRRFLISRQPLHLSTGLVVGREDPPAGGGHLTSRQLCSSPSPPPGPRLLRTEECDSPSRCVRLRGSEVGRSHGTAAPGPRPAASAR